VPGSIADLGSQVCRLADLTPRDPTQWPLWQLKRNANTARMFSGEPYGLCPSPDWKVERKIWKQAPITPARHELSLTAAGILKASSDD